MAETILYVDDEPAVLRAMTRDLRPWLEKNDLKLETLESAAACMELLENTEDDVVMVISDLRMPGMKGSELLEILGRTYPNVGLVLLTAYSDMDDITRAVSADICGLIIKPWDVSRLTAELDRMVRKVEQKRLDRRRQREVVTQLKIAGDFQFRFFESPLPSHSSYTLEVSNRPSPGIYVTGDYYDAIHLDDDRVLLLLGDVSGHGVKPAFVATMIKLIVNEYREDMVTATFRTNLFLDYLNTTLLDRLAGIDEVLVSFSAVLLDLKKGVISYASGGNPPLYLVRDRSTKRYFRNFPALAFSRDIVYESEEIPIQENDRVVIFTDGVYDRGALRTISDTILSAIFVQADGPHSFVPQAERLLSAVDIYDGTSPLDIRSDDLTLVTIKIKKLHDGD